VIDLRDPAADAVPVIAAMDLHPHSEDGHYREIWRDASVDGGRRRPYGDLVSALWGDQSPAQRGCRPGMGTSMRQLMS
jgi:hypothetical protein